MTEFFTELLSKRRHLSAEHLISLRDKEGARWRLALYRAHVSHCWECSAQLDQIQRAIFDYVEFRSEELKRFSRSGINMEQRLMRLMRAQSIYQRPSHVLPSDRFASFLESGRWKAFASATIAGAVVLALMLLSGRTDTVSAAEMLQEAVQAEMQPVGTSNGVLHTTYSIERVPHRAGHVVSLGRVELWRSHRDQRSKRGLYDAHGVSVTRVWTGAKGQILPLHHAASLHASAAEVVPDEVWLNTPSAVAFARFASHETPTLQRTGNTAFRLASVVSVSASSAAAPHLVYASMEWNRSTRRATGEELVLRQQGEDVDYRLSEIAHEEVEGDAAEAELSPVEPSVERADSVPISVVASAMPLVPVAGFPSLVVDVLSRLNSMEAFSQGRVVVTRGAEGELNVRGTLEDDDERSRILESIGSLRLDKRLHIALTTEDAALRKMTHGPQRLSVSEVDVASVPTIAELSMRARFLLEGRSEQQAVAAAQQWAFDLVRLSDESQQNAQALAEIVDNLNRHELSDLDRVARGRLEVLLRERARAVENDSLHLLSLWSKFYSSQQHAPARDLQHDGSSGSSDLFSLVRQLEVTAGSQHQLVLSAAVMSAAPQKTSNADPAVLTESLQRSHELANRIASLTTIP